MTRKSRCVVVQEIEDRLSGLVSPLELKAILRTGDFTNHELCILTDVEELKKALVLSDKDDGFERHVLQGQVLLVKDRFQFSGDKESIRYDPASITVLSVKFTSWDVQTKKRLYSEHKLIIYVPPKRG